MNSDQQSFWKKCSSCKKPIAHGAAYYVCSVSTCQHKRKGFQFCSVPCWDAHLGYANHREAWALEQKAPARGSVEDSSFNSAPAGLREPKKQVVRSEPSASDRGSNTERVRAADSIKTDTLVVVSKVKALIREQSDFSTSQCCIDALTKKVVAECLKGIERARTAERKTVMGRDIEVK